jgi:hypothetical protein
MILQYFESMRAFIRGIKKRLGFANNKNEKMMKI